MKNAPENELGMARQVCRTEDQPVEGYLEAVDRIVAICLRSPELVGEETLSSLGGLLRRAEMPKSVIDRTLIALAVVAYSVPALLSGVLEFVRDFLKEPPEEVASDDLASSLFLCLVKIDRTSSLGAVVDVLHAPALSGPARGSLLAALPQVAEWNDTDSAGEQIRQLLDTPGLSVQRRTVGPALERLCLRHPEEVTPQLLELLASSKLVRDFHYLRSWLVGRKSLSEETRGKLGGGSGISKEIRSAVRRRLGDGMCRVLIVHNINDSRSCEIVRVTPLADALLALNPRLEITLVTRRRYLYDHPRVEVISVENAGPLYDRLNSRLQAVIDFYEAGARSQNYRPDLELAVQEHVSKERPLFIVAGKGKDQFTFSSLMLGRMDYAADLDLDVQRVPNVYDPSYRLAAVLGVPLRMGEERPDDGSILVASHSDEARAEWTRLTDRCGAGGDRPIALVNPFGESDRLRGFTPETAPSLAAELEALVGEGYSVVILPNGLSWGTGAEAVNAVRSEFRPFITTAPDLVLSGSDSDASRKLAPERADQVMRWFKYFLSYADLIVTVEGWLMHLAYQMGRPYSLWMMPYSGQLEWHPFGASARQHIVAGMSSNTSPDTASELLRESDGPPQPRYPRKELLLYLLQGLEKLGGSFAAEPLLLAGRSVDRHVRAAAIAALARFEGEEIKKVVLGALRDRSWEVRAAAAEALLRSRHDLRWELDDGYERVLRCHSFIGKRRWNDVLAIGKAGMAPLMLAMEDEDPTMRREAKDWFVRLTSVKKEKENPWT